MLTSRISIRIYVYINPYKTIRNNGQCILHSHFLQAREFNYVHTPDRSYKRREFDYANDNGKIATVQAGNRLRRKHLNSFSHYFIEHKIFSKFILVL